MSERNRTSMERGPVRSETWAGPGGVFKRRKWTVQESEAGATGAMDVRSDRIGSLTCVRRHGAWWPLTTVRQEWMVFGSRTYRMPPGEGGSASGCRRGEGAHACLHQLPLPDGRGLRKRGVRLKYKLRTWVRLALPGLRARYPQGVLQKAMPLS